MRTILPVRHRLIPAKAQRVFEGKIFDVYQWEQELYDGSSSTFEMLKRPDTVNVIAIKDDKLVILLEEQPSMGPAFYGLPGGVHDAADETELEAAKRELQEETGLTFRNWKLIGAVQPQAKIEWMNYLYLASDFDTEVGTHPDPGEKIEVKFMELSEVQDLIGHPSVRHLPDIIAKVNSIDELLELPEYKGSKL
jgi:ADP-ribose pyrophosphatase